jgi:hypothetical protein
MQETTEDNEASILTENAREDPKLNRTVAVRRKAAKRTLPWDLAARELLLASPPQDEEIRARKKRRLEEPLPTTTDEAARKTSSPEVSVGLPPYAADNDDVNVDPVTCTQPNAVATRATGRWTTDEDAELTSAVANTSKKRCGKEYKTDWVAIAALVPSRTRNQCSKRWHDVLDPSIDRANGRTGKWTEDEDRKLKDALKMHGAKNWGAINALIPGRTKKQCWRRWHDALNPSIDRTPSGRTGKWSGDEDRKLKDALQMHGAKDWAAVAALVPGRTKKQCWSRWHDVLTPSIAPTAGRSGKWAENEDRKLKDAVQTHGGKDWVAVAALVPGRTKKQCWSRWHDALTPSIATTTGRTGKWAEGEDSKLKDAVQTHGGRDWAAIAALVSGRTRNQCSKRWHDVLDPSISRANARTGKWTEDEDRKLKDAVQIHGNKDWVAINALVPGRTKKQCWSRWHDVLTPSIAPTAGRSGKWAEGEDSKLKDAVQTPGDNDWVTISALVPGRTKKQCWSRWKCIDPNNSTVREREHGILKKAPALGLEPHSP